MATPTRELEVSVFMYGLSTENLSAILILRAAHISGQKITANKTKMAQTSPFILAVLIFIIVVAIILVTIIFLDRRTNINSTSTPTKTTQCTLPPAMPINLTSSNPESDILTLTWSPLTNVDTYTVYIGTSPGFNINSPLSVKTVTTSSVSFGNLQLGTTYYLKLTAKNPCGISPMSAEISATIPFVFPSRFIITKRNNPLLEVCKLDDIFFNADQHHVSSTCTNDQKIKTYNSSDQTIRRLADNQKCLTRISPDTVWDMQCGFMPGQDWVYNFSNGTLCSPSNPLTECLYMDTNNSFAKYGNITPLDSSWNIVPT